MNKEKKRSYSKILKILKGIKSGKFTRKLRQFIQSVDVQVIRVLAEIALNIHRRRLGISSSIKSGLQQFNDLLHKFGCSYRTKSDSEIERNRDILLNHNSTIGSGLVRFLRFLIQAAFKILPQIIANILTK